MKSYEITLPLPTSINAAHTVGRGGKSGKNIVRSKAYNEWLQWAGIAYRAQIHANGFKPEPFAGRLRVDYIFIWVNGSRGTARSDIGNREKVLSDFLQGKFFLDDNQIDEQHQYRRIIPKGNGVENHVIVRVTEIRETRNLCPKELVNNLRDRG